VGTGYEQANCGESCELKEDAIHSDVPRLLLDYFLEGGGVPPRLFTNVHRQTLLDGS
jgi:hypothetical protein